MCDAEILNVCMCSIRLSKKEKARKKSKQRCEIDLIICTDTEKLLRYVNSSLNFMHCTGTWNFISRYQTSPKTEHRTKCFYYIVNLKHFLNSSLIIYLNKKIKLKILWGREAPEMKYRLYDNIEVRYNNALTFNSTLKIQLFKAWLPMVR